MTDKFDKYVKYSHLDKYGHRVLNDDAQESIKIEARKLDEEYFKRTGRHMIIVE